MKNKSDSRFRGNDVIPPKVGTKSGIKWWNYWGPVCAIVLLIFIASSISHPPTAGIQVPEFDKFLHAIVYGFLGYFARRAFRHTKRDLFFRPACAKPKFDSPNGMQLNQVLKNLRFGIGRFAGTFAVLFCLFYGAFDEIHQSYVPPRETDPLDLAADVVGAFIGQFIQRIRNK